MVDDSLDALCTAIGYLVVSILIFAIPILTALSFVFNWYVVVKFLLIVLSIFDYFLIFGMLIVFGERGEG